MDNKKNSKINTFNLSTAYLEKGYTQVDNKFLAEYLPLAKPSHSKVYLFALYIASNNLATTLEAFAASLKMKINEVMEALEFWQKEGLISISSMHPFQVTFLSVKAPIPMDIRSSINEFRELKAELSTIKSPVVARFDYNELQHIIDTYDIEISAIKQVVSYAISIRKMTKFSEILKLLKSWGPEITTFNMAQEKIKYDEEYIGSIIDIKTKLFYKKSELTPSFKEIDWYNKWLSSGFNFNGILVSANFVASQDNPSMSKLNNLLENLKSESIFEGRKINEYLTSRQQARSLAIEINQSLGNYEKNVSAQVDNYVMQWLTQGFLPSTLKKIAAICYKYKNINRPQDMGNYIESLLQSNKTSSKDIDKIEQEYEAIDKLILKILNSIKSNYTFKSFDRDNMHYIIHVLGFKEDAIEYAALSAKGKTNPISYIKQHLENLAKQSIFTLDEIKAATESKPASSKTRSKLQKGETETVREFYTNLEDLNLALDLQEQEE